MARKKKSLSEAVSSEIKANFNLESFKNLNSHICDSGNYWDVSDVVLENIEGPSYIKNKENYNRYLLENPGVAKCRGINTFVSHSV